MSDAARSRLAAERKNLIESRPAGCYARPTKKADGAIDLMRWEAGITPLPSSLYALAESGTYRLILEFAADYPASPPKVSFSPPIFHTNVFGSGAVCLSLLLTEGHHPGAGHKGHWQATLTLGEVLKHMQVFLDEPNPNSMCVHCASAPELCPAGAPGPNCSL